MFFKRVKFLPVLAVCMLWGVLSTLQAYGANSADTKKNTETCLKTQQRQPAFAAEIYVSAPSVLPVNQHISVHTTVQAYAPATLFGKDVKALRYNRKVNYCRLYRFLLYPFHAFW